MEILLNNILMGLFTGIILGCYIYYTQKEIKDLRIDNNNLINRLMAKDYKEYAAFKQNEIILNKETVAQTIMKDQDVFQVD